MESNFWQGTLVRLRGIEPGDADAFFDWNLDSSRGQRLDFLWPPVSRQNVKTWTAEKANKKFEDDAFHWVIENADGVAVGSINTFGCDSRAGVFSQAFDIAGEHRRKGYAAEAVWIVLKYYFRELRFQKVLNGVHAYNDASMKLHERLGFSNEGRLRRMIFTDGKYFDKMLYGMTVEEFEEREATLGN